MKDKLLELVNACIGDNSMYTHTYIGDDSNPHAKQYRGINERIEKPRTAYVEDVFYKGESVSSNKEYQIDTRPFYTQGEGYNITIGFGKEPQITIRSILKGNKASLQKTNHQASGTRNSFFNKNKPCVFDIVVVTESYHYELRCGSFAYIVDDDMVKDFYDIIVKKRVEIKKTEEEKEIDSRLEKYKKS